jgi:tetratricopeptide (TPR) repeat protein
MDTDERHDLPAEAEPDEGSAAVDALVAEAESLGAEERWDQAQTLLLEALPDHPHDALLLCWLGIASERLGEEGEAYDFFRRCLSEEPSDPFILAAAGSGVAMYDDPGAEAALRLAAITAPGFPFARSAYGAYLAREGLFDEALRELSAARDLPPTTRPSARSWAWPCCWPNAPRTACRSSRRRSRAPTTPGCGASMRWR